MWGFLAGLATGILIGRIVYKVWEDHRNTMIWRDATRCVERIGAAMKNGVIKPAEGIALLSVISRPDTLTVEFVKEKLDSLTRVK